MRQLTEAAIEHARQLRHSAYASDGYGARATIGEVERWEALAKSRAG
jgi:hypothetical protein